MRTTHLSPKINVTSVVLNGITNYSNSCQIRWRAFSELERELLQVCVY
jgi:hypothetical protein